MGRKPKQVFLLYETTHQEEYLLGVHATIEGAQHEMREHPLHPWSRPDENGIIAAKPIGSWATFGAKIVPTELGE
jgi:hypothetical protein